MLVVIVYSFVGFDINTKRGTDIASMVLALRVSPYLKVPIGDYPVFSKSSAESALHNTSRTDTPNEIFSVSVSTWTVAPN